jgi:hypothetical protein
MLMVALVGHVALVVNAANSLEVETVHVDSVAPGVVLGIPGLFGHHVTLLLGEGERLVLDSVGDQV